MTRTLILSGTGRYADPWHPLPETTARIADILTDVGHRVTVETDIDRGMRRLDDVDLLVVNAGDPWRGGERGADPRSIAGFDAAIESGIGVFAFHSAVASLRDYPRWAGLLGAVWLPTLSFHPPFGGMDVQVERAVGTGFSLEDERYCALQGTGEREIVAWHAGADERREPAAWRRIAGRSRIAVDVLGHDSRSYDSEGHAEMIVALATWCVAR